MVQHRLDTATGASAVSHISSNGYYGFSYLNAAHEPTDNNSDVTAAHARQNINNTNINTDRCVPNANDVNGMDFGDGAAAAAAAFGNRLGATQRCKKRYFVSDDDYANCELLNNCDKGIAAGVAVAGGDVCAAKRCRFDDDYDAAQYCNDFFSLPSTQIGTQSCLMDTEDAPYNQQQQQQQPQVDVNMGVTNLSNQTGNTTSNIHYITTKQHAQQLQPQQKQQQQQVINASQAPPVVVYQQQHNYQGHLHRANRDVSRCLLSHMI